MAWVTRNSCHQFAMIESSRRSSDLNAVEYLEPFPHRSVIIYTKNLSWKLTHTICIFLHFALLVSGIISAVLISDLGPDEISFTTSLIPGGCMAVSGFGIQATTITFLFLLKRESRDAETTTEGEHHWNKQVATFFSSTVNLTLSIFGVALVSALGWWVRQYPAFGFPLAMSVPYTAVCLGTAVYDAAKNYREGLDLLD